MIRYLLDTDIFSYLVKRRFPNLESHYRQTPPDEVAISAIVFAEVLTGLALSGPQHPIAMATNNFLSSTQILDWPIAAANSYALIRQRTRQQPLAERDMLIAAHAMAIDATLVTNNTKHFSRIGAPLRIENWLW